MAKFMIIHDKGNIIRTINLPYEGKLIDISAMPEKEWEGWFSRLHEVKVNVTAAKEVEKDDRGLPKIIEKSQDTAEGV